MKRSILVLFAALLASPLYSQIRIIDSSTESNIEGIEVIEKEEVPQFDSLRRDYRLDNPLAIGRRIIYFATYPDGKAPQSSVGREIVVPTDKILVTAAATELPSGVYKIVDFIDDVSTDNRWYQEAFPPDGDLRNLNEDQRILVRYHASSMVKLQNEEGGDTIYCFASSDYKLSTTMEYYEKMSNLFKGKQLFLRDFGMMGDNSIINDGISGKDIQLVVSPGLGYSYGSGPKFEIRQESGWKEIVGMENGNFVLQGGGREKMTYYTCTDVAFTKEGKLIVILEKDSAKFGITDIVFEELSYGSSGYKEWKLTKIVTKRTYGKDRTFMFRDELENMLTDHLKRKKLSEAQRQQLAAQQEREAAAAAQKRKQALITKYGDNFGNLIFARKVAIGMSQEMCREAWGRPLDIQTTTTALSTTSVWIYSYKTKLRFTGDKLVKIEN